MSAPASPRWRALLSTAGGWRVATWALLAIAALVVAATFSDYGSTWDDAFQSELGRDVVAWFRSWGSDDRALRGGSPGNLQLYGGLHEAVAELAGEALPLDPFDARHLVNGIVALLGAAGTALLARRLGGWRAAFLGAALLLSTPPWWGHGILNSKDIPFATAYLWLLVALLRMCDELPRPRRGRILAAGGALGAALAARPGGLVLLLPVVAGVIGVRLLPVLRGASGSRSAAIGAAALRLVVVTSVGWAGMLAAWPYGLKHPISGPLEAIAAARRFRWLGLVRFDGQWVMSDALPWTYAPTWFGATLPESWLVVALAAAVAAGLAWRRDCARPALSAAWLDRALVLAAAAGPVAAAVITRPVLYDGIRHLLFCLPPLAALGGWGLSAALDRLPRWGGRAAAAAAGLAAALAVADAVRLHPYEYAYFNRLVAGGLPGASGRFELDYWGSAGREAAAWMSRNVAPGEPLATLTTAHPSTVDHWLDPVVREQFLFDGGERPAVRVAGTRWLEHRATGRVLHVVERAGVPLLYVIDAAPSDGPLVLEAGDAGVALSPAAGWSGVPRVERGSERAVYDLSRSHGAFVGAELTVFSPRGGEVPALEELRGLVAASAASAAGLSPQDVRTSAVVGGEARGWLALVGPPQPGAPFVGVAGARVGPLAFLVVGRFAGDRQETAQLLQEWIHGARLAAAAERRPP